MSQSKKRNTLIVIVIAIAIIACAVIAMNYLVVHAGNSEKEIVTEANLANVSMEAEDAPIEQNTIIYYAGVTLPEDAVSAQYAISLTTELADKIYGQSLDGRIYAELGDKPNNILINPDGYWWFISAETAEGEIWCVVDAMTGKDIDFSFYKGKYPEAWAWYDTWNEEVADGERIAMEEKAKNDEEELLSYMEEELKTYPEREAKYNEILENDINILKEREIESFNEGVAKTHEFLEQDVKDIISNFVKECVVSDGTQIVNYSIFAVPDTKETFDTINAEGGEWLIRVELDNGEYLSLNYNGKDKKVYGYRREL